MIGLSRFATFVSVLLLATAQGSAQQIDLSLNVRYNAPNNPNSGGTWQLVGKSSHSGIVAIDAFLAGINAPTLNVAPRGTVNGDSCIGSMITGCAGFFNFAAVTTPQYVELVVGQAPVLPAGGDQEGLFYGVGTLTSGSPLYPGKPGGTNSIGPNMTTLANVTGVPWAVPLDPEDVFSDEAWDTAAILAGGTFATNQTPGFLAGGNNLGKVFTTLGDIDTAGTQSSFAGTTITTIVRTNLNIANVGDYNGDGTVNAADYTVWRDTLGATGVPPASGADGSGNGTIDAADYDVWKRSFGTVVGSGAGSGLAVPEPATGILAALAVLFAVFPLKSAIQPRSAWGRNGRRGRLC